MDQLLSRATDENHQQLYQIQQVIIEKIFSTIQSGAYRLRWVDIIECLKEAVVTDIPYNHRYLWSIQQYHWETDLLSNYMKIRYDAENNWYVWHETLEEVRQQLQHHYEEGN